jgi:uncharacterized protein with GYD domain
MPTYIVLMEATEKSMLNPNALPERVQAARDAIQQFGGKMLDWNLTMGEYDAVAKVEFPDDYALASFTLAVAKTGNQKTITMRAFNEAELRRIVEKIPV